MDLEDLIRMKHDMHQLSRALQVFGDANAIGAGFEWFGGSSGFDAFFDIPGVHVGLAATHVEVDDVFGGGDLFEFGSVFESGEGLAGEGVAQEANTEEGGGGFGGEVTAADVTGAEEFGGEFGFHSGRDVGGDWD